MRNIKYSKKALNTLKKFIYSYKESYIRLIKDSGINYEKYLIDNYIVIGDKLYKSIINKIYIILSEENVLGVYAGDSLNHIIFSINSFKVFVYYSENSNFDRIISNIEFHKK